MKCPYCGHENKDDATICEHCYAGFPIKDNKPEQKESETKPSPRRKTRS